LNEQEQAQQQYDEMTKVNMGGLAIHRPAVRTELKFRKERLEKELALVNQAIEQLDQTPEVEKLLDLFRKIGV
jgi:hypothetical protein